MVHSRAATPKRIDTGIPPRLVIDNGGQGKEQK
ncbi:hypothetical protein ACVIIV_006502 [Bradyrhizobium sp. USDA 4354]